MHAAHRRFGTQRRRRSALHLPRFYDVVRLDSTAGAEARAPRKTARTTDCSNAESARR
jgi:hypothetical protein